MGNVTILAAAGLLCLSACSTNIFTPPAHIAELQGPRALEEGASAVALSGGTSMVGLESKLIQGGGTFRKGFGSGLEGAAGFTLTWFEKYKLAEDFNPWMGSIHAGAKWNPPGCERFLALTGGFGAGHAVAGEFVSVETGLLVGFENDYFVPYAGGTLMANQPFLTRTLDMRAPGDLPRPERAEFTRGAKGMFGIKLPIDPKNRGPQAPKVFAEGMVGELRDDDNSSAYFGIYLGVDFPLGR